MCRSKIQELTSETFTWNVLMFWPSLSLHKLSLVKLVLIRVTLQIIHPGFCPSGEARSSHWSLCKLSTPDSGRSRADSWFPFCLIGVDCWPTAEGQNRADWNTHTHTHPHSHEKSGQFRRDLWGNQQTSGGSWRMVKVVQLDRNWGNCSLYKTLQQTKLSKEESFCLTNSCLY